MSVTIQDLYNETAKIEVRFAEYPQEFSVEMINNASRYGDNPRQDCKIGSWVANYYFRTARGEWNNDNRYKTIGGLKRAIISASKKRNLRVLHFTLTAN